MEKIVFIDRDGVINIDPIGDYIKRWEDFRFEPGAIEGLQMLSHSGYGILIISNQAGVGDGVYPRQELERIHQNMVAVFKEKGIRFKGAEYCLHGKKANCDCRKPKPGLLIKASQGLVFDKASTYFIGDKISDIQAGQAFGIKTIFVLTGHGKYEKDKLGNIKPDLICPSLLDAARSLLG